MAKQLPHSSVGGREAVGIPGITTSLNRRTPDAAARSDRRNAAAAPTAPTPRDMSEVCARAVYTGGGCGTGMAEALTVLCCQG